MTWPKIGPTQYHAQLGLPDKGRAVIGLVVWKSLKTGHGNELHLFGAKAFPLLILLMSRF